MKASGTGTSGKSLHDKTRMNCRFATLSFGQPLRE